MNQRQPIPVCRGFVLAELVAIVIILTLVVCIASLLLPDARRRARLAGSIQNLQQLGKSATAFAADKENRVFSFDWEPGLNRCDDYVFPASSTHTQAAADQAICIMRRLGNRPDIQQITAWIPHVRYSHLALADYLGESLPSAIFASPGDAPLLAWSRAVREDPNDPNTPYFNLTCRPAGTSNGDKRWPYSSSYELQPSFYSPDALAFTPNGPIPTVAQAGAHNLFSIGTSQTPLGTRRMDEVAHPANKAMMYETNQRFFGSLQSYFMYSVRIPVLCADGSASVRSTATANAGFHPNTPFALTPPRVNYSPDLAWETPTENGATQQLVNGGIRWTRSGLRGRDFGGPEVPWVP
jgi:hypothetical protein